MADEKKVRVEETRSFETNVEGEPAAPPADDDSAKGDSSDADDADDGDDGA